MQPISRANSLKKSTDSITNTTSDIVDRTHADDNTFSDIIAEAMISIGLLQNYLAINRQLEAPISIAGWI
jgi:hypothetical protein